MTDEKETPEGGEAEPAEEAAEEVAEEKEATEEVVEAEAAEEVVEAEAAEEVVEAEAAEEVVEEESETETDTEARFMRRQLEQMTIKKLREVALELGDIAGVHGMKKAELIEAIFALRGAEGGQVASALAEDKSAIKKEIRELKVLRASALEVGDSAELKRVRKRIKRLKRTLRRAS